MGKKILLIGAGGIGFRHFQALFNCEKEIEVYVVDVNDDALKKAQEYELSLNCNMKVFYSKDFSNVPEYIDVAIIATSSRPRRDVFDSLVRNHTVFKIIFEKFLFPRKEDYKHVAEIISNKRIEAYVDCVARMYDFFNQIKAQISGCKYFVASIKGSNWGLACNAIHMLHLIAYLSESDTKKIACSGQLENKVYKSKRTGYIEFFGRIVGDFGNRVSFSIECNHAEDPFTYEFFTDKFYYYINENEQRYSRIAMGKTNEVDTKEARFPYVSQITNLNVDRLLRGERALLPTYDESKPLHEALLNVFHECYEMVECKKMDLCPIT